MLNHSPSVSFFSVAVEWLTHLRTLSIRQMDRKEAQREGNNKGQFKQSSMVTTVSNRSDGIIFPQSLAMAVTHVL